MADEKFPYGREINDFGTENNAAYFSNAAAGKSSYKNNSSGENTANAGELSTENTLASDLSIEAESTSSISAIETATEATGGASIAATTATATAGATVIAVTIGIVTLGASAAIIAHNFAYSSSMINRSIYYSLEVEAKKDTLVFVHLLDENQEEVDIQEFEITTEQYAFEGDRPDVMEANYYPIYGEFNNLHYHQKYTLEAFYYEEEQIVTFYEQKDIEIEFTPFSIGDVDLSFNASGATANVYFEYYYTKEDAEVKITFTDVESKEVTYEVVHLTSFEEYIEDYGEDYYRGGIEVSAEGLVAEHQYDIDISIDNNNLYHETFLMPVIEQRIFVDDFSYEADPSSRRIDAFYVLKISQDETVYLNLYDDNDNLTESKEFDIPLGRAEEIEGEYFYNLITSFEDLAFFTNYHFELFYYASDNKVIIDEQYELFIEIEENQITNVNYQFDASRRAMRITNDIIFKDEQQAVFVGVFDVTGNPIYEESFYTIIDETNPGFVDYGEGYYAMRFTSKGISGLAPNEEYRITYSINQETSYEDYVIFPESEEVIPYVCLDSYSADYNDKVVRLSYTYNDNGVTYSSYIINISNLHFSQEVTYHLDEMSPEIIVTMESLGLSAGYTYRFNLCGVDSNETETILSQNAIYY